MAVPAARSAAVVEFDHVTKRYDAPAKRKEPAQADARAPSTTCR